MKKSILLLVLLWFAFPPDCAADYDPYSSKTYFVPGNEETWIRWLNQKPYGGIQLSWNRFATYTVDFPINDSLLIKGVYIIQAMDAEKRVGNKIRLGTNLKIGLYDGSIISHPGSDKEKWIDIETVPDLWEIAIDIFYAKIKKDRNLKEEPEKPELTEQKVETKQEKPTPKKSTPEKPVRRWLSAAMHIYPGVKVYYGEGSKKRYMGTVLDIGQVYDPYKGKMVRAILFEMPSGSKEWKHRDAVLRWGYVLSDDPTLKH